MNIEQILQNGIKSIDLTRKIHQNIWKIGVKVLFLKVLTKKQ